MRFSIVASALVTVLVGFGSTLAIVVQAARHLGATPAETASWIAALCVGMAATSIWLSLRYRMPIITAWSLAAAVLIVAAPPGTSMGHAIGAFLFAAVLTILCGTVPAFGNVIAKLPSSIAGGMLAGLLLRFALALFTSAQADPVLVLPLVALFLLARLVHPASAALVVILFAFPLAWWLGYALPAVAFAPPSFVWVQPELSWATLVSLGIPCFLVTMATQQISGVAVLRTDGYTPPVAACFVVTGVATLLLAPFGGYSINLSSVTASICTGPDTHPDPAKRYLTGPVFGLCYLLVAIGGASLTTAIVALPPVLVAAVVGVALLGPLTGALASALQAEDERLPAILAFLVTASNLSLFGIGGAFWGLLAGTASLGLERLSRRRR